MGILAWIHPAVLAEYALGLGVRVRRSARGQHRHRGTVPEILHACVDACWDGRWYVASPGHFRMFWTRDLAFAAPALARSSERERARVRASLERALEVWIRRRSHVTTTIHFFDHPGDAFAFGVDSVPLLLAALRAVGADDLVDRHRSWLAAEVAHYCAVVVDPSTGLVRADRTFSAHRDTVVGGSTAYANSMVALLAQDPGRDRLARLARRPLPRRGPGAPAARALLARRSVHRQTRHRRHERGGQCLAVLDRRDRRSRDAPHGAGDARARGLRRPPPAALRDEPTPRARGVGHPPPPAQLPGQHDLDEHRLDVPVAPPRARSAGRRGGHPGLRRLDPPRRDVLGGARRGRTVLGQPAPRCSSARNRCSGARSSSTSWSTRNWSRRC